MLNLLFPSQLPVYFIPGWGLGYQALEPSLAQNIAKLNFIHLPGYNGSKYIADFDLAVDSLVKQLPLGQFVLGGWSLGAMLALAIAARYPQRIGQLYLIAPTPSFVQRDDSEHLPPWTCATSSAMLNEFQLQISSASAEDFAILQGRFIGGFNRGDKYAKDLTKYLLQNSLANIDKPLLLTGLKWLAEQDLRREIPNISAQIYIQHGVADSLIPVYASRWLMQTINSLPRNAKSPLPQCILDEIKERAHAPFISAQLLSRSG